jgi:DNA modification methylase/predicted RNA-binding Zn-ribbon protein involved in translation (DUF1610 family)
MSEEGRHDQDARRYIPPVQETLTVTEETGRPVTCLGLSFASDAERRSYFTERLREKLADPTFRAQEGFPIGSDADILALSDPPYYTACPNPFLEDFMRCYGKTYDPSVPYHREPFATDVSEGKNDPIYKAHSYHTKVPHKAIMRYILHYTEPRDIVFDGFCGTGMTGVAAQMCGTPDPEFRHEIDNEWRKNHGSLPKWGTRRGVVSDLSPIATFIAYNYNVPVDASAFSRAGRHLLESAHNDIDWMYQTKHTANNSHQLNVANNALIGRINYTVWSEVFICPHCSSEVVFLEEALDSKTGQVGSNFICPNCGSYLAKRMVTRAFETFYDVHNGILTKRVKRVPVLINYTFNGRKYEKKPDSEDITLLETIEQTTNHGFFPSQPLPYMHISHIKDKMPNFHITHFSHFFLPRQQHALTHLWMVANRCSEARIRHALLFLVEQCVMGMSVMNRFSPNHFSQANRFMSGVLYVPSQISEVSPWYILEGKLERLAKVFGQLDTKNGNISISLNSGSATNLPSNSIDYIFTDPPFGENLQYSELNWFVESFHKVLPDTKPEAVINQAQHKDVRQYMALMLKCFQENYRVLKPGRWMTVEFHSSQNSVWTAIQEAIQIARFVVADTRVLDKIGETYKQSRQGVVKADLVISAYKPTGELEDRFNLEAGSEEGVWDFVHTHLKQLPIFVPAKDGCAEVIAERLDYLLFDRMVAFHVQRGVAVPLSAPEFYAGLRQRFPQRDEMFFLEEQVAEYERKRLSVREIQQLTIFVKDEATAILFRLDLRKISWSR